MLIFLLISICTAQHALNITLDDNQVDLIVDETGRVQLNISSAARLPFSTIVYSREGGRLFFKGIDVLYKGRISYISIKNLVNAQNKINLEYTQAVKEDINVLLSIFTLITFTFIILFGINTRITKALLILLLTLELYRGADFTKIGGRLKKNLLRIK